MAEGGVGVPRFQRSRSIIQSLSHDEDPVSIHIDKKQGLQLIAGLKKMRYSFTDITLVVDGVHIRAHKIILSAFSPYFEALLSPNMLEGHKTDVEIHELNGSIVSQLVDFAYTGAIMFSHETVQDVLEIANFLGIKLVQHECVKFIVQKIDSQNCADVYKLGRQLGEEVMFKLAMKYFMDNFVMMTKTAEFLDMPPTMIDEIVRAENLQSSEPDAMPTPANQEQVLLNAILHYVTYDEATRLPLLPGFLANIRLPTLLPSKLTKLKVHNLVKKSAESLALVEKAAALKPELDVTKETDVWLKPRNNQFLTSLWSRPFAGGQQIAVTESMRYDDSSYVPITAHLKAMKIYMRRWGDSPVWGGYDVRYNNGYTVHHGGQDFGYETYTFELEEDEMVISLEINSGWLIDQVTFKTSKNRTLGPYGGPGGGRMHNGHSGRGEMGGYLVCMNGAVVHDLGAPAISSLRFQWAHSVMRLPEPIVTGSDNSDIDSGECDNSIDNGDSDDSYSGRSVDEDAHSDAAEF